MIAISHHYKFLSLIALVAMGIGAVQVLATVFAFVGSITNFSPDRSHFENVSNRGLPELVPLVLFVAIVEEFVFRRFGFNVCIKFNFNIPMTIITTSLFFGVCHWPGTSWFSALYTAMFGLLLGWVYSVHRPALTGAIVLHIIVNLTALLMATFIEEGELFTLTDFLDPIFLLSCGLLLFGIGLFHYSSTKCRRQAAIATC